MILMLSPKMHSGLHSGLGRDMKFASSGYRTTTNVFDIKGWELRGEILCAASVDFPVQL